MKIALLIVSLLPRIMDLVKIAEEIFADQEHSGAEKKDWVMRSLEVLLQSASEVFTGGALDTFNRIKGYISLIIDAAAGIAFPNTSADYKGPANV